MDGWIKLHRKFIDWEYYTDRNTKDLFIHLLLLANHKERNWKGIVIKRGQLVTSIKHLAEDLGLTTQEIRTSLKKLKKSKNLTSKSTNKYTLITIENYSLYQDSDFEINKQNNKRITNEQQTNNKRITTNKNIKNNKNNKKEINNIYNFFDEQKLNSLYDN